MSEILIYSLRPVLISLEKVRQVRPRLLVVVFLFRRSSGATVSALVVVLRECKRIALEAPRSEQ